jgi:hypothetical protein
MIGCQCTVTVRPGSEIDGRFGLWGRPAADDCRIAEVSQSESPAARVLKAQSLSVTVC